MLCPHSSTIRCRSVIIRRYLQRPGPSHRIACPSTIGTHECFHSICRCESSSQLRLHASGKAHRQWTGSRCFSNLEQRLPLYVEGPSYSQGRHASVGHKRGSKLYKHPKQAFDKRGMCSRSLRLLPMASEREQPRFPSRA